MHREASNRSSTCSRCGTPLTANELGGGCPKCFATILLSPDAVLPSVSSEAQTIRRIGDYELLEEIARGGMGIVFRARQISLNREVAVKLMRDSALARPDDVKRFRAEAAAAAKLKHPNIVAIHEVSEEEGQHYFVMDLVEGMNLAERTREGPLLAKEAAELVSKIADAVQHAHEQGVLHRDVKPSNVLVDATGKPFVADFGLARSLDTDSSLTMTGQVLGTPGYMAPEQATGKGAVGPAADIYSLGALLYYLVTGHAPFVGGSVGETLRHVVEQEPVSPQLLNPEVPRELASVCLKCLAKRPGDRYDSASVLADDLRRFIHGEPTFARPAGHTERLWRWCQRKPALSAAIGCAALIGVVGFAGVFWQWRRAESAAHRTREELWHSQLLEARSYRLSRAPGQHNKALEVIAQAAKYRPSVDLRSEAIAALVLPDLGSNVWRQGENALLPPQALTSDLKFFARPSERGGIAVCRSADRQVMSRFGALGDSPKTMRFSPDDSLLGVKFRNGTIGVWRWRDGQLLLQTLSWPDKSDHVPPFDFTPDGREFWLSDSHEQLARYSLPEGKLLPPPPIAGLVRRLRFNPSGQRLLGWSGQTVTVWDVTTGAELGRWTTLADVWCAAWHPGGNYFALGSFQAGVQVGEIGQSNLVTLDLDADSQAVLTEIGFTPDGTFVLAGGWGNFFGVWDFATRKQILRTRAAAFTQLSRDGVHAATLWNRSGFGVRTFHAPIGIRRLRVPTALGGETEGPAWHPGGRWLVTGHPSGWALWDTTSGQPVLQNQGPYVRTVQFLPGGDAFLTGGDAGAQLWPFDARGEVPRVGPPRTLTSTRRVPHERAALSPDGKRFAAVGDYAWLGSVAGDSAPIPIADARENTAVSFSPDGRWLCLSRHTGTHLKIRDALTGSVVTNLLAETSNGRFMPAGDQLVSVTRGRVTFWRVGTWEKLSETAFGDDKVGSELIGFSRDGNCALISDGNDITLRIWNLKANTEIATLWLPAESGAWGAAFDPSGQRMASAAGHPYVDLWDLAALRRELARLGLDWRDENPSGSFAPRRP